MLKITTKPASKKLFACGRHRNGNTAWVKVSRGTQYYFVTCFYYVVQYCNLSFYARFVGTLCIEHHREHAAGAPTAGRRIIFKHAPIIRCPTIFQPNRFAEGIIDRMRNGQEVPRMYAGTKRRGEAGEKAGLIVLANKYVIVGGFLS